MKSIENAARFKLIASMAIFGTIGIFRSYIPLPSSVIAFVRGAIGMLFLLLVITLKRQKINFAAIKKNLLLLCLSGAFIGVNWILLFEAYRYTSVSTATLCYYMAPVLVIIASPFILKEKLTAKKILCTLSAFLGMLIISGVSQATGAGMRGVLFGLGAAALYATVIILNKFIKGISDTEKTLIQLGSAAVTILPYVLLTENLTALSANATCAILLIIVGIIHTGLAYTLYFGSIEHIKAQTAAMLSYLDPVIALILSAILLREGFTLAQLVGSILILGAAFISEMPKIKITKDFFKKSKKTLDKQDER